MTTRSVINLETQDRQYSQQHYISVNIIMNQLCYFYKMIIVYSILRNKEMFCEYSKYFLDKDGNIDDSRIDLLLKNSIQFLGGGFMDNPLNDSTEFILNTKILREQVYSAVNHDFSMLTWPQLDEYEQIRIFLGFLKIFGEIDFINISSIEIEAISKAISRKLLQVLNVFSNVLKNLDVCDQDLGFDSAEYKGFWIGMSSKFKEGVNSLLGTVSNDKFDSKLETLRSMTSGNIADSIK